MNAVLDMGLVKGMTALMEAVISENTVMVRALLEVGANANAKDADGRSVLDWAKMGGKQEITELLKKAGAKE